MESCKILFSIFLISVTLLNGCDSSSTSYSSSSSRDDSSSSSRDDSSSSSRDDSSSSSRDDQQIIVIDSDSSPSPTSDSSGIELSILGSWVNSESSSLGITEYVVTFQPESKFIFDSTTSVFNSNQPLAFTETGSWKVNPDGLIVAGFQREDGKTYTWGFQLPPNDKNTMYGRSAESSSWKVFERAR